MSISSQFILFIPLNLKKDILRYLDVKSSVPTPTDFDTARLDYFDNMDTNDYISCDFQARDIYEEAIETVLTVRDFTQVFDAYAEFEKNVISAKIQTMEETGASEEGSHIYYRIQSHVMQGLGGSMS